MVRATEATKQVLWKDITSLGGFPLTTIIAITLLLLNEFRVFWQITLGVVGGTVFVALFRLVYFRKRPTPWTVKGMIDKMQAGAMPSVHTMRAAIIAVVLGTRFGFWPGMVFALAALLVAHSRVRLKYHWWSDVIAGLVLGGIIGWVAVSAF